MDKVRAGSVYYYDPVPWDRITPPYGVQAGLLKAGDRVRVVNLPGCPKANTMRMCHIETEARTVKVRGELKGEFLGLVSVHSLTKEKPASASDVAASTVETANPRGVYAPIPMSE